MDRLDLAVLDQDGVALGAVLAEDGGRVEGHAQLLGEFGVWVAEEADAAFAAWVEAFGPGAHSDQ